MAYVNVAEWSPEHVADWLRGLDDEIQPYTQFFVNNSINGCHLLTLCRDDLANLNITKIGHQELVLDAVELLKQLHYNLTSETLQSLALKLGCKAQSLFNHLKHICQDYGESGKNERVSTETLSSVSDILNLVKSLISWLDRYPFAGQEKYGNVRKAVLKLSVELASTAQRDQFAEMPHKVIKEICHNLSTQCDKIVQEFNDSLIIQPAILEVAKVKRKADDDVGINISSSYTGIHIIESIKFQSPAYRCGKIEDGDEIIQVNYQTMVGWQVKNIICALKEHPSEVHLTLKKRPRHPNVLGQVITLWPYRIPSKKTAFRKFYKWNKGKANLDVRDICPKSPDPRCDFNSVSENYCIPVQDKERQLFFGKSRNRVRRRATVTGISPTALQPLITLDDLISSNVKKKQSVGRAASYDPGRVGNVDDSVFKDDIPNDTKSCDNPTKATTGHGNIEKKPVTPQKSQFLQPPTDKYLAGCLRRQQPVTEISPQNEVSDIKLLVDFSKAANEEKTTHSSLTEPPQTTVTLSSEAGKSSPLGIQQMARPATNGRENFEKNGSSTVQYSVKESRPTLSEIRALKRASEVKNPNEKVGTHVRKNTLPRQPFLHKRNVLLQQNRPGGSCIKYVQHKEEVIQRNQHNLNGQRKPEVKIPQVIKKSEFTTPIFSRFPYAMHESKIVSLKARQNGTKCQPAQGARISYVPHINGSQKTLPLRPFIPLNSNVSNSKPIPRNAQNGKKVPQPPGFNPAFGRSRSYNDIAFSSDDSSLEDDDEEEEDDATYEEICEKPKSPFIPNNSSNNSNPYFGMQKFQPELNKNFAAKVAEVYYMLNQGHCFPSLPNNGSRNSFNPASSAIIDELAKQMYHALRKDHLKAQHYDTSMKSRNGTTTTRPNEQFYSAAPNYRVHPNTIHSRQSSQLPCNKAQFYQQYPVYSDGADVVCEKPVNLSPPKHSQNKNANQSFKSATSQEIHNLYTSGMTNKPCMSVQDHHHNFGRLPDGGQGVFDKGIHDFESFQFLQRNPPQYHHYTQSNMNAHIDQCNQMFCPAERESEGIQCNDQIISTPSDGWKYFDKGVFCPIKEEEHPVDDQNIEEFGPMRPSQSLYNGNNTEVAESTITNGSRCERNAEDNLSSDKKSEKSIFTFDERKKGSLSISSFMSNIPKPPEDDGCYRRIKSSSSQTDMEPNISQILTDTRSSKVHKESLINLGNDESFLDCAAEPPSFSNCSSSSSLSGSASSSTISSTNSYYLVDARIRPGMSKKSSSTSTHEKNDAPSPTSTGVPLLLGKKRTPPSGGSDSGCHSESHSHHLSMEDIFASGAENSEVFKSTGIITDVEHTI